LSSSTIIFALKILDFYWILKTKFKYLLYDLHIEDIDLNFVFENPVVSNLIDIEQIIVITF